MITIQETVQAIYKYVHWCCTHRAARCACMVTTSLVDHLYISSWCICRLIPSPMAIWTRKLSGYWDISGGHNCAVCFLTTTQHLTATKTCRLWHFWSSYNSGLLGWTSPASAVLLSAAPDWCGPKQQIPRQPAMHIEDSFKVTWPEVKGWH
jgi:hypothetical protein